MGGSGRAFDGVDLSDLGGIVVEISLVILDDWRKVLDD